ncbi:MAG: hypothetical protein Q8O88_02805 [bacterium]|nr:hypothetical protein [bacterium]
MRFCIVIDKYSIFFTEGMKRWSKCRIVENASLWYYPNGAGELVKSPIATCFPTPGIRTGAEHHQKDAMWSVSGVNRA